MDASTLHLLAEDLAAYLSEATPGDLGRPVAGTGGTLAELYLTAVDGVLEAVVGEEESTEDERARALRAARGAPFASCAWLGLDGAYRDAVRRVVRIFDAAGPDAEARYERLLRDTVVHTWDVAHTLGFEYRPDRAVAERVLRGIVHDDDGSASGESLFQCVLVLSGRARSDRSPVA
ncbi:hypothetical protein P0W64_10700 [Tsukamurella sp. 8F]|uniref:hypothetical protein n=1 Tax=unclassified Tsukamurella TaxID=2633480 RepID=UPI0023B923BD|nr:MULTISPECIES: hypothetical protein [unclassified Tsukamurella]MDF0529987.1 hypothetical protein [Tsukamurella sp. 8J]MDF0587241.1 hypothetical protein [Tsukamurella sp. 8F]